MWLVRLVALAALSACNRAALAPAGDGGADLASPGPGFCGDSNSARAEVNGMLAVSPSVTAQLAALNCCDAAELSFVSAQLNEPLVVFWRHQVGAMPTAPATLDLANLPAGWGVSLASGCTSLQTGCMPTDRFDSGLTGSLTINRTAGGGYQMSVCLGAMEAAAAPHPLLHTVRLWSPQVSTP
jgi:hypothetical protein